MIMSVMQKDWFAIFLVKITVKVQNFIESDLLATREGVLSCY